MSQKSIARFILVLCLTAASLAALFGLLAGTQGQAYAASSRPVGRDASVELLPPFVPAANPPLAPLFNGSETSVITVCNTCPYTSVQAAVSAIPAGGIVKVAQGTYTDDNSDNRVVYITQSLTLQGGYTTTDWSTFDPVANPTILDGEGSHRVIQTFSGVSPTIAGFYIRNGSGALGGGAYIGSGVTLQRNRIYDNAATGNGGGVYVFGGSPTLVNNLIYTNTAISNGGGVYVVNGAAPLLLHDTLYDNEAGSQGGGIYIVSGAAPVIRASIVVSNTASEGGGIYGASGTRSYNDVWGNDGGDYGGGATPGSYRVSGDPLFVDPSGPDLYIQPASPCRDQVPLAQTTGVDYRGLVRPFGGLADIGAYEFYTGTCFAQIEGASRVYSTAQAAVDAASAGDLVQVAGICRGVEDRTVGVVLTQTVFINKSLTLRGGYTVTNWADSDPDAHPTTLDAQGKGRVIYIANGAGSPTIENLRIVGGDARGMNAEQSKGSQSGGGIYNYGGGPTIRNNIIYNNQGNEGGGIYNNAGSPKIQNNTIYSNSVLSSNNKRGGGIYIFESSGSMIQSNWIYSNTAQYGGGIYLHQDTNVSIQSNHICSNTAIGDASTGGGVHVADGSSGAIEGNWIYTNTVKYYGGGVYVASNSIVIEDNWIYDNYIYGTGNEWGQGGGGICATGNSTIRGNRIYSNTVPASSGGGVLVLSANAVIEQNTIRHNNAKHGGGIYVRGGSSSPSIENNLVHANADHGIEFSNAGGGTLDGNSIYGNNGDGVYANSGSNSITIRNSIIVSNTVYGVLGNDNTVTYSDVWGNTSGNYGGGAVAGTGVITANPQFVNPGVDFYLQPGSPCIDKGDPSNYPPNDYAGYARPFGSRPDMGAYEFYTGACFAQIEGATRVYTTVQTAVDTAIVGSLVKVAGVCQGAQSRVVGSGTFTQAAYISQSLTLRGGYTVSVGLEDGAWVTPTYQTILDPLGQGRTVYITGTGAVTVDGFIMRGGSAITGGGLYVAVPLSPTVQNVIFHGNTAQYGGGLASAGGNPRLYNNTFVTNTATVTGGGLYLAGGSVAISNTIVVSNAGGGIWAGTGVTLSLAYNDVGGNAGGDYAGSAAAGATDFWADPLFVDFAGGDFHLKLDSPCIHTADPGTGLAWDLEGDARPLGRGSDIGADEAALYADVYLAPFSWLGGVPDEQVAHPHILTNTGTISDTFDLTHTLVASGTGWVVDYTSVFTLVAGEAAAAPVVVTVPSDAVSGTMATVVITATSRANSDIYDVVSNTTMANWNPGVTLTPAYTEHVNAGTVLTYEHTLLNTGNAPDTFAIGLSSSYGWATEVTPTLVTDLAAQGTITVWVRVEIPATAPGGLIETTVISASSSSSGAQTAVTDTTQVNYTVGDRYVSTSGDDDLNNCLVSDSPCRTIVHAVDQAVSGDMVKVAEGNYNENNVTINKNITLRGGYSGDFSQQHPEMYPSTIDAQGAGRVFYIFGAPTVEGFTIKGGNTAGSGGGIYIYSLGAPIIRGNTITGNVAGVYGGGIHNEMGNPTIERNALIYNEAARGGGFSSKAGNPGFWSNMVYDNAASADGGGVYVSNGNARIWHDTIYSNEAGQGGGIYLAGGSSVISNTIVVKNTATITGGGIYRAGGGAALDYNDVWDNTNGDYVGVTPGPNSMSSNPRFMQEAARDLSLSSSSPCENEGDATTVAQDYGGDPRTMGAAPDIGADEIRRLGVELEPDGVQSGSPDMQLTYDHTVTNTGNYTDTFTISAVSSHGWTVEFSDPVAVGAGRSEGIWVRVTIPSGTAYGVEDHMIVTATSEINTNVSASAVDTTTVNLECGISWRG